MMQYLGALPRSRLRRKVRGGFWGLYSRGGRRGTPFAPGYCRSCLRHFPWSLGEAEVLKRHGGFLGGQVQAMNSGRDARLSSPDCVGEESIQN
jgi:hypothetical protein